MQMVLAKNALRGEPQAVTDGGKRRHWCRRRWRRCVAEKDGAGYGPPSLNLGDQRTPFSCSGELTGVSPCVNVAGARQLVTTRTSRATRGRDGAMADRSDEEIRRINDEIVQHTRWLRKRGGRRGDLSFHNLAGMELKRLVLTGIKFTGTNLTDVNLSESDLSGADFFGADLEGADLTSANLAGADFRGANMSRATLAFANLRGADFRSGQTSHGQDGQTKLIEANLQHAALCEANLTGCDMSGADLLDADFKGADLTKTVLIGADLTGASFEKSKFAGTIIELSRLSPAQAAATNGGAVEIEYPVLAASEINAALDAHRLWMESGGREGRRFKFECVALKGAALAGRDLSGAWLRRCSLRGINLAGTQLNMADLSYCDLREAVLEEGSFRGANFRRSNLGKAMVAGAMFDAMPLDASRKWPANFEGAILHDADLTNTSFAGAVLINSDLSGAILQGASLKGVDLSAVRRSAVEASGHGARERRKSLRHAAPTLYARSDDGNVHAAHDWSFGGMCLKWSGAPLKHGSAVTVRIAAEGSSITPPQASLIVTATQPQRGTVSFRFVSLEDDVRMFLNSLLPAKYQKK